MFINDWPFTSILQLTICAHGDYNTEREALSVRFVAKGSHFNPHAVLYIDMEGIELISTLKTSIVFPIDNDYYEGVALANLPDPPPLRLEACPIYLDTPVLEVFAKEALSAGRVPDYLI